MPKFHLVWYIYLLLKVLDGADVSLVIRAEVDHVTYQPVTPGVTKAIARSVRQNLENLATSCNLPQ